MNLIQQCEYVIEFSLIVEVKVLIDNKYDIEKWKNNKYKDVNTSLCSKDFNQKLELLSKIKNISILDTLEYIQQKVKERYN